MPRPQPRLTVAIPTYNFGAFIGQALDSLLRDIPGAVELLVVDGASTDGTDEVVRAVQARAPQLRYVKLDARGGIDADVARTVEFASGDYVWLFSADDVAMPGAVASVLDLLRDEPDVLLLAHTNCAVDMRVLDAAHPIVAAGERDFHVRDAASRNHYFAAAATTEALFSFLSGLIIRKRVWQASPAAPDFFRGSCWGHAARLLVAMRDNGLFVRVRTEPLLHRRGDNDSFLTAGVVARYALAIDGYRRIVSAIFGEDGPEMAHTRRVLAREFDLRRFLIAKLTMAPDPQEASRLRRMFDALHHAGTRRLAFRLSPPWALKLAAAMIRGAKRPFKATPA